MRRALLLLLLALAAASSHVCVHDAVRKRVWRNNATQLHAPQAYAAHARVPGRRLAAAALSPLRVAPLYIAPSGTDLSTGVDMTPALAAYVTQTLMPAAIARWGALLSVVPVAGGLLYTPTCTTVWASNGACRRASAALPGAAGDVAYTVPASLLAAFTTYPTSASSPPVTSAAGAGLPSADFGLYVSATTTSSCTGSVLAYAYAVARDQYDRPTWGRINFCPRYLSDAPSAFPAQLSTAMHELNHALGFTSESWPLWRLPDGVTPRTPRSPADPALPAPAYAVRTSCGGSDYVAAPSSIAYVAERGMSASWPPASTLSAAASGVPWAAPGNAVAHVVTPAAAAAAQAFFACPALSGPELENHDTSSCFVQGSHWEGRLFRGELMASTAFPGQKVSAVTLGLHEDSGWYVANYSAADGFRRGDFGYQQGCAFAQQQCSPANLGSPPHWRMEAAAAAAAVYDACTTDATAMGAAVLTAARAASLPAQYRYFPANDKLGASSIADFCPYIHAYGNGDCRLPANQAAGAAEYFGQTFSASSRCFPATGWVAAGYQAPAGTTSACFATACAADGASYAIAVPSGAAAQCSAAGAAVTLPGFSGHLTCADPAVVCGAAVVWAPASPSASASPTPTPSASPTATRSGSGTPTRSARATPSPTPTPSPTASLSRGASPSASATSSASASPTPSPSPTPPPSATPLPSATPSPSPSTTPSAPGGTPSPTPSLTASSTAVAPGRTGSVGMVVALGGGGDRRGGGGGGGGSSAALSAATLRALQALLQSWLQLPAGAPCSVSASTAPLRYTFTFLVPLLPLARARAAQEGGSDAAAATAAAAAAALAALGSAVQARLGDGSLAVALAGSGLAPALGYDSVQEALGGVALAPVALALPGAAPSASAAGAALAAAGSSSGSGSGGAIAGAVVGAAALAAGLGAGAWYLQRQRAAVKAEAAEAGGGSSSSSSDGGQGSAASSATALRGSGGSASAGGAPGDPAAAGGSLAAAPGTGASSSSSTEAPTTRPAADSAVAGLTIRQSSAVTDVVVSVPINPLAPRSS